MPYTKLQSTMQQRARVKYVNVKEFCYQYSMSKAQAYKILSMPEMSDAIMKTGPRNIKVNLDRAFELMQQLFN